MLLRSCATVTSLNVAISDLHPVFLIDKHNVRVLAAIFLYPCETTYISSLFQTFFGQLDSVVSKETYFPFFSSSSTHSPSTCATFSFSCFSCTKQQVGLASCRKQAGAQEHVWAKVRGQGNNWVGIRERESGQHNMRRRNKVFPRNQMCLKVQESIFCDSRTQRLTTRDEEQPEA